MVHGCEEVRFFGEGELRSGGGARGFEPVGDPLFLPAADGETFEDVVVVLIASLSARLAGGTVLFWGSGG